MQTFLPLRSWADSARVLDYRRLGKQRVECKQILAALGWELDVSGNLQPREPSKGWVNHPATQMWKGYEVALASYQATMIREWIGRGYNNTMIIWGGMLTDDAQLPPWLDDERVYASHRSNLLRKDPVHYGQFGWEEPDDIPYHFPVLEEYEA